MSVILDQFLEDTVRTIYKSWYQPEVESVQDEIDRARYELAEQLQVHSANDETQAEELILAFIERILTIENISDVIPNTYRVMKDARGGRPKSGLQTDLSLPRRQELLSLLRVADPATYIISRMYYKTHTPRRWSTSPNQPKSENSLVQTLRNVSERVFAKRSALSDETIARVNRLMEELSENSESSQDVHKTIDKNEIERVLKELERLPEVVRVAMDLFLSGKTDQKPQARLSGDSGQVNVNSEVFAVPRSASPLESITPKSVSATPRKPSAEPISTASATPRGASVEIERIAPEEAAAVQPHTGAPASETVALFNNVQFPHQVKRFEEEALIVQLTIELREDSRAPGSTSSVPFTDRQKPEYIEIIVNAPGFEERTGVWSRTILAFADQDSQPAIFLLTAKEEGEQLVTVEYRHKDRHLSQIAFKTTISAATTTQSDIVDVIERQSLQEGAESDPADEPSEQDLESPMDQHGLHLGRLLDNPPAPADLEVRVTLDHQANKLHFMLHSSKAEVGYHWRQMGSVTFGAATPQKYLESWFEELNLRARGLDGATPEEVRQFTDEIEQMGNLLFEQLFPEKLQNEWKRIMGLRQDEKISSLLITSDEPWIPWELVKPHGFDEDSGGWDDGFLSESFQLCRWLPGRSPMDEVTVTSVAMIAPDVGLPNTEREVEYLTGLEQQSLITLKSRPVTLQQVKEMARAGGFQLLHVSTHGNFDAENPERSSLELENRDLLMLRDFVGSVGNGIRSAKPLVFLNACHSAQVGQALTLSGAGGWADRMIQDLRVSAFVGTLWEVNDILAADFSIAFYENLQSGQKLAEAFHNARLTIKENHPDNSTWLAYTLYGDPNAQIGWKEKAQ